MQQNDELMTIAPWSASHFEFWYETALGPTTKAKKQRTAIRSKQKAKIENMHLAELEEIIVKILQGNDGALTATADTRNSNRLHR